MKKTWISLWIVAILCLTGCAVTNVRTVVIEQAESTASPQQGTVQDVSDLLYQDGAQNGKRSLLGFDQSGRMIGVEKKDGITKFFAQDFTTDTKTILYETVKSFHSIELADGGNYALALQQEKGNSYLYEIDLINRFSEKKELLKTEGSILCFNMQDGGYASAFIKEDEKYEFVLFCLQSGERWKYPLESFSEYREMLYDLQSTNIKQIYLTKTNEVMIRVQVNGNGYLIVSLLGEVDNLLVLRCADIAFEYAGGMLYYVSEDDDLMMLDIQKQEESIILKNVSEFKYANEQELLICLQKNNQAGYLYAVKINSLKQKLIDIREGNAVLWVNENANLILAEYQNKDEQQAILFSFPG